MDDEILTPDNVTPFKLFDIYTGARMDPRWTSSHVRDYDIEIWEPHRIYVVLDDNSRYIQLRSFFDLRSEASLSDQFLYANRVNSEVDFIRAGIWYHATIENKLEYAYYFGLDGGLRTEALIQTTKRFFELIDAALAKDIDHVIKEPSWGG